MPDVAIIGAGFYGFKPSVPELSFRELVFEAARRAYSEAGIDPRKDVAGFISCQEDFWEGIAITDEFAPEPLGGVLRPTFTVAGDLLQGIAQAFMMIKTGLFDIVAVESHSKQSDIKTLQEIYELALDPLYLRQLRPPNPLFMAGIDAQAYMMEAGASEEDLALVSVKNRNNGIDNPRASYSSTITLDDVMSSGYYMKPIKNLEVAGFTDGAVVFVLASGEIARKFTDDPVWVKGVGWSTETGTGGWNHHVWGRMISAREAAKQAFKMSGLNLTDMDSVEIEDRFTYLEPLFLDEIGLSTIGYSVELLRTGDLDKNAHMPVNMSGGSQSIGVLLEATGGSRLLEAYLQLKGKAGYRHHEVEKALVASWRGPPTYTTSVLILSR
ncbi:MAG: thiolase domain-containing protein [Desulfurococcales archaeon]|nr:thiolase domain-containing protein [Desulfurococcales archaeon]